MFKLFCLISYYLVLCCKICFYFLIHFLNMLLIFSVSMANIIQAKYNIIYKLIFLDSKQRGWL